MGESTKLPEILGLSSIAGVFSLVLELINMQTTMSSANFSIPIVLIWLLPLFFSMYALSWGLKSLSKSLDFTGVAIVAFSTIILGYTTYLFVQLGFNFSYLIGILFFVGICFLVAFTFYLEKSNFKKIWKETRGKLTLTLLFFLFFIFPSALGLVQPVIYDPVVEVSPSFFFIAWETSGEQENGTLFVKAIEGYAWDVQISVESSPPIYAYIDNMINGVKTISSLEFNQVVTVPLRIASTIAVANGTYQANITWSYKSAFSQETEKSFPISIYIGEIEHTPQANTELYVISLIIPVIMLIIIVIYNLLRRR